MKAVKTTIAFDVNGTLSLEKVRQLFLILDRSKCTIIVWSTLGGEYARRFCQEHNLEADEYLHKEERLVDIAIDDYPDSITAAELLLGVR